jgi:hypothetical protein
LEVGAKSDGQAAQTQRQSVGDTILMAKFALFFPKQGHSATACIDDDDGFQVLLTNISYGNKMWGRFIQNHE